MSIPNHPAILIQTIYFSHFLVQDELNANYTPNSAPRNKCASIPNVKKRFSARRRCSGLSTWNALWFLTQPYKGFYINDYIYIYICGESYEIKHLK